MTQDEHPRTILPAEYVGEAFPRPNAENGWYGGAGCFMEIGTERPDGDGVIRIPWGTGGTSVYVRRDSADLSVIEIHIARHDGYGQEELDAENDEAARYPLGPKEYWRGKMVGKYRFGADAHLMTNADFEADWDEQEPWFGEDDN